MNHSMIVYFCEKLEPLQNDIQKALTTLRNGELLLYPTDTVWGLGCDATNADAISSIYRLKRREQSKSMICLVDSIAMLKKYVSEIPETAYQILESSTKPTTIIYDNPMGIADNIISEDNTLAIRVVKDVFCKTLIKSFKKPIVSTSANISSQPTPKSFEEISDEILKGVDYVVNLHRDKQCNEPSSIIKINNDGQLTILRA